MKTKVSIFLTICLLSLTFAMKGWTDDDSEENEGERSGKSVYLESRKLISTPSIMSTKFKAECTSCHMAYPPGLLPARSWTKMMSSLDKHFGEDASMDEKTRKDILDFLVKNSSDQSYSRRGGKILSSINKMDAPLRISETSYFIRKHDELSANVFKRKAIGSKSNCLACHSGAESGNFNEHEVRIPRENESPSKVKKI